MKKDNPHGGKREGSGAPLKFGEPTVTIPAFRVPESKEPEAKKMVKEFQEKCISDYQKTSKRQSKK